MKTRRGSAIKMSGRDLLNILHMENRYRDEPNEQVEEHLTDAEISAIMWNPLREQVTIYFKGPNCYELGLTQEPPEMDF